MAKYHIYHSKSQMNFESSAKTLIGAKREATSQMTHGGGGVSISDDQGNVICGREFVERIGGFKWMPWINAEY